MNSKFLSLNWHDFVKGLALAVITAVVTYLYGIIQSGSFVLNAQVLGTMGTTAILAGLSYLLKNLGTSEDGKLGGVI